MAPRRKSITVFKAGGHWIFKHFFDDSAIFKELADYYNKGLFRFEFKTVGERNKALKLLELRGFEVEQVGGPHGLRDQAAQVQQIRPGAEELHGHDRDPKWRILLMKDLAAVEEAQRQGAKLVEVEMKF